MGEVVNCLLDSPNIFKRKQFVSCVVCHWADLLYCVCTEGPTPPIALTSTVYYKHCVRFNNLSLSLSLSLSQPGGLLDSLNASTPEEVMVGVASCCGRSQDLCQTSAVRENGLTLP